MRFLLTNDDGIDGEGLKTLASVCKKAGHDVLIVAPTENNSAVSHKLTMRNPLRAELRERDTYAVSGTPADCVLFALKALAANPDIVISGINDGVNLGSDVLYSGTVAGAMEGAQNGIPSIALSLPTFANLHNGTVRQAAEIFIRHLAEWTNLAQGVEGILNVNFPSLLPERGIRLCRCSKTNYCTHYHATEDGSYTMEFHPPREAKKEEADIPLHHAQNITLTPLRLNLTDEALLRRWRKK